MHWIDLNDPAQLDMIRSLSTTRPQVIFKHSTRCSISTMAKSRLERATEKPETIDFYYLDLLKYRDLSNQIADLFGVYHESPQVIVIKDGDCIYDESHNGISMDEIIGQVA